MIEEQKIQISDWWLCECATGCDAAEAQDLNIWSHDICATITPDIRQQIIDLMVCNGSLIINALDIFDIDSKAFYSLRDNRIRYCVEVAGEYYHEGWHHVSPCNINDVAINNNYIFITGDMAEEALSRMPKAVADKIRQTIVLSTYHLYYEEPFNPDESEIPPYLYDDNDTYVSKPIKHTRWTYFLDRLNHCIEHHSLISEAVMIVFITILAFLGYWLYAHVCR